MADYFFNNPIILIVLSSDKSKNVNKGHLHNQSTNKTCNINEPHFIHAPRNKLTTNK